MLVAVLFVLGATIAYATTGSFSITVPAFGSKSSDTCRTTSSDNNREIGTKYTAAPEDSQIKAIRCADGTDISGYKFVVKGDLSRQVLAANVIVGTRFRLNINTPGNTFHNDTFKGKVDF